MSTLVMTVKDRGMLIKVTNFHRMVAAPADDIRKAGITPLIGAAPVSSARGGVAGTPPPPPVGAQPPWASPDGELLMHTTS